ncbi:MAG: two-component system sensor histidine kinase CreC, partial [Candidatus Thioglobus sp.]
MKFTIGVKLFIAYFIISGAIVWFVTNQMLDRATKGVDHAAEEVMIDASNLLAQMVSHDIENDQIDINKVHLLISAYLDRELNASIYSVVKKNPSLQVYVTNQDGIVIYDSSGIRKGKDYSRWNDVYDTLRGKYGKRSSSLN